MHASMAKGWKVSQTSVGCQIGKAVKGGTDIPSLTISIDDVNGHWRERGKRGPASLTLLSPQCLMHCRETSGFPTRRR